MQLTVWRRLHTHMPRLVALLHSTPLLKAITFERTSLMAVRVAVNPAPAAVDVAFRIARPSRRDPTHFYRGISGRIDAGSTECTLANCTTSLVALEGRRVIVRLGDREADTHVGRLWLDVFGKSGRVPPMHYP